VEAGFLKLENADVAVDRWFQGSRLEHMPLRKHSVSLTFTRPEPKTGLNSADWNSGVVLEQVCEYLYFHNRYLDMTNVPDMEIPPELSLELALAADFLECTCYDS
jgi:hypothetical protein